MAAGDKGAAKGAQSKRAFRDVVSTPGRRSESPLKNNLNKQSKKEQLDFKVRDCRKTPHTHLHLIE